MSKHFNMILFSSRKHPVHVTYGHCPLSPGVNMSFYVDAYTVFVSAELHLLPFFSLMQPVTLTETEQC